MKIKDVLYEAPEMTEEKLLELIGKYKHLMRRYLVKMFETDQDILNEWDLIQDKKSKLTRSQRDQICGLVGMCLIKMTKNDEEENSNLLPELPEHGEAVDV